MWYVADKYLRLLKKDQEERDKLGTTKSKTSKSKKKMEEKTNNLSDKKNISNGDEGNRRRSSRTASKETKKANNETASQPKKKIKLEKIESEDIEPVNGDTNGCQTDSDPVEIPWVPVHVTEKEITGLVSLIDRLREWQYAQKCVPKTIEEPDKLLDDLVVNITAEKEN